MTKLTFFEFIDYEKGKMARMETTEGMDIPVNIFIDNADECIDMSEGFCQMDICAVGPKIEIFPDEAAYKATGNKMAIPSMIPIGTFSPTDDENFEESPHILFTGTVMDVEWNPNAEESGPNCCLTIETLEMTIDLYLRYDAPVKKGAIVHGVAWLFGEIKPYEPESKE